MSHHVITARRPQRQAVVRVVPPDATAQPEQASAPSPGPAATSSRAGGSARHWNQPKSWTGGFGIS
jgi:hypothetical protein